MLRLIVMISLCVSCTANGLINVTKWNNLKVTWNQNFFHSGSFATLPRTEKKATDKKFTKLGNCDVIAPWRGKRYIKNDFAAIPLFDKNGYIAGLQASIPNNKTNGYPKPALRPPFLQDGDRWVINIYFVDPSKICTSGRSKEQFKKEGTGTNLYIQNSTRPEDSITVPREEERLEGTQWVKGKCRTSIGRHYWYRLTDDMSCDSLFPVFLVYNQNKLNGFGFLFIADLTSDRYEYPGNSDQLFMVSPPTCLESDGVFTMMHVFLNSNPLLNFC